MLRRSGIDLLLLLLLAAVALRLRLEMLDPAMMGSDSISPYLKAYLVATGKQFFPHGPFPESGYLVAYTFVPYLWLGDSLRGALTARFCLNALGFIPIYLGLTRVAGVPAGLPATAAGVAGALVLALSPGLADTLLTGYQTFDVSLYATLPTLAALFICFRGEARATWLLIPWLPLLAMLHPYAFIYALAAPWLLFCLWRDRDRWAVAGRAWWKWGGAPVVVAAMLAAPQLYRYLNASRGRSDGLLGHLESIARSPGQFDALGAVLVKAFREELLDRDLFPHGFLVAAPVVTLVLLPVLRRRFSPEDRPWLDGVVRFTLWVLALEAAMITMAALVRYLQPYHLRVLFPPLAAQLALLLTLVASSLRSRAPAGNATSTEAGGSDQPTPPVLRLRPGLWMAALLLWTACAVIAGSMLLHRFPPPPAGRSSLKVHEALSAEVQAGSGSRPIVLEFLHLSNDFAGYPGAVVLDQLLAGAPESRFLQRPEDLPRARFFFAVTGPEVLLEQVRGATEGHEASEVRYTAPDRDLILLRIDGLFEVRRWSSRLCEQLPEGTRVRFGGANDYLGILNPAHDTSLVSTWFSECLVR